MANLSKDPVPTYLSKDPLIVTRANHHQIKVLCIVYTVYCVVFTRVYPIWQNFRFCGGFVKQRAMVITNSLVYFFWNLSKFRHATETTPISKNGIFSYFWHICGYSIAILQDINLAFEDMKYHNMASDWEKDLWTNIEN